MHGRLEGEQLDGATRRPAIDPAGRNGREAAALPLHAASDLRAGGAPVAPVLLALQARAGNAAVQRLISEHPAIQRAVEIDEIDVDASAESGQTGDTSATSGSTQAGGSAGGAGGVAAPGGTGSGTTISDTSITLDAPIVNVNAAIMSSTGVIRASTIVADSIVASSYTPGAGNLV